MTKYVILNKVEAPFI